MAIKRYPIIKSWQVNLYCDKCGEVMQYKRSEYPKNSNELHLLYTCICGHEELTKKVYPYQEFALDLAGEEIIND